jgi:hypothetical protein
VTLFYILAILKVLFLGAVYGRMDGGGIANTKEWTERSLIMFFFVLACAPFAGLWALLAYAGVVGIATGHGQYFLSRAVKYIGDTADGKKGTYERVDPFVSLFFGKDPRTDKKHNQLTGAVQISSVQKAMNDYGLRRLYWRNVFGMFCTGFLVGLPAAVIALSFSAHIPAALFFLTGFVKSAAYVIGHAVSKNTESAEYINGAGRNAICLGVIFWFFS